MLTKCGCLTTEIVFPSRLPPGVSVNESSMKGLIFCLPIQLHFTPLLDSLIYILFISLDFMLAMTAAIHKCSF